MPRELKTNGVYAIVCALTGEQAGTTPAVFAERAKRYDVAVDQLKDSYVGRTGAKLLQQLVNERGMTPADATAAIRESFGVKTTGALHENVVDKIVSKVTAKAKKAAVAEAFKARKAAAMAKLLGKEAVDGEKVTE